MNSSKTDMVPDVMPPKRCAVYTRSSPPYGPTSSVPSLKAQRAACEAYVAQHADWKLLSQRYEDRRFSGANLSRPALAHLLGDVRAGKVDIIVVERADRLSRFYLDFASLMEQFHAANARFVSVSEEFSTTGELGLRRLDMVMSFAPLERVVLGERASKGLPTRGA